MEEQGRELYLFLYMQEGGTRMLLFKVWKYLFFQLAFSYLDSSRVWNNTSWADGGDMEASRGSQAFVGTATDGLCFGGYDDTAGVAAYTSRSESYSDDAFSDATSLLRAQSGGGCGTSSTNAILPCGSLVSGNDATNQLLNTTTWSNGSDVNVNRTSYGSGGSNTDAIIASGYGFSASDEINTAERLDDTTWSNITAIGIYGRYSTSWGGGGETYWHIGGIQYNSPYGSPTAHVVNRTPKYWDGSSWADDTDSPTAGGTSGGKYNCHQNGGRNGNSGTEGAMFVLGKNYTAADTHASQTSVFEATW